MPFPASHSTWRRFGLAAAALLATSTPAWADQSHGFGVATSATAGDPYPFIRAFSAYRTVGDASGNLTVATDTPPLRNDPCPGIAGSGFTCSATLGGTDASGDNLTASTSQASLTTSLVAGSGDLLTASAGSRASLVSATLGVVADTGYRQSAHAFASFNDTLSFQIAGAQAATVTLITVELTLTGSLAAPNGHASIDDNLQFGAASARSVYTANGPAQGGGETASNTQGGWVSHAWLSATPTSTRFSGVYALQGAAPVLGLSHRLIGVAGDHNASSLYGDGSDGAVLQLVLPQQVSFSSASGSFLTSPVPEPATALLWALGLGGLGLLALRRNAPLQWAHARRAVTGRCSS